MLCEIKKLLVDEIATNSDTSILFQNYNVKVLNDITYDISKILCNTFNDVINEITVYSIDDLENKIILSLCLFTSTLKSAGVIVSFTIDQNGKIIND